MSASGVDWRAVVVGGHTRSIGKTQLVCDLIAALPEAEWIAGKITQYGHGVCAQNGEDCDCAPDEHVCAISWEQRGDTGTDSSRFLAAGAKRAFWLRTKQGFLAEGMPLLREALREEEKSVLSSTLGGASRNLILESNSLMQFWRPALYLMVLHPGKSDFKESARLQLDRASAFVLREALPATKDQASPSPWAGVSTHLLRGRPIFLQPENERLPQNLVQLVRDLMAAPHTSEMHRTRN